MRDIKFRAWHKKAREYCEGTTANMFRWIEDGQPIILEQYTGLKDKNGVEIYEGDIVRLEGGQILSVDLKLKKSISYGHGDCGFSINIPIIHGFGTGGDFTVIGNTYESPELIGE